MLNEKQHQILAFPIIQELIKSGEWTVHDGGEKTRALISNRVQTWLTKAEVERRPRILDSPKEDQSTDEWIKQQRDIHGPEWCPF